MTWQFSFVPYSVNCWAALIALALWVVLPHAQAEIGDMRGFGSKYVPLMSYVDLYLDDPAFLIDACID
jgi:hypothetical protein